MNTNKIQGSFNINKIKAQWSAINWYKNEIINMAKIEQYKFGILYTLILRMLYTYHLGKIPTKKDIREFQLKDWIGLRHHIIRLDVYYNNTDKYFNFYQLKKIYNIIKNSLPVNKGNLTEIKKEETMNNRKFTIIFCYIDIN